MENMNLDFAAKDEGNPLFITDEKSLHCKSCSEALNPPTRQCTSGHLFCYKCHHGHVKCLLCPENTLYPAPSLDAILSSIMEECPNKKRGCPEKFPFYQLLDHKEECCEYDYLKCPIPHCSMQFAKRYKLASHLTKNHKRYVDRFTYGKPTLVSFDNIHGETKILLEDQSQVAFVAHYVVEHKATVFKFFCLNFSDDGVQYMYKITNRMGGAVLLGDAPVPITTFVKGTHAIDSRELSHDWRTGKSKDVLDCNFLIKKVTSQQE